MSTSTASADRREQHLVDTEWLAAHLHDPGVRVVDMRGFVRLQTADGIQTATYVGAPEEYAQAHIPGAIYLDWTRDIADPNDPIPAQVAQPEPLAEILGRHGIGDEHLVVAYDAHPANQFATRLWWVFRYYGHDNVRVLDGGWPKWLREDRPVTAERPDHPSARFTPQLRPEWRTTAEQVAAHLGNHDVAVVDARDEDQYTGRIRRGSRGGHIPGAIHLPREALCTAEGLFRPTSELQEIVQAHGLTPDRPTVAYCNGGIAATSVLFTLSILGFDQLINYDGSWNEWAEREELPVQTAI